MELCGKRVLIIPNKKSDKTEGGVVLTKPSQEERNTGVVISIGDEVPKKYDKRQVLFNKMAKDEISYEGMDAVILTHFGDIIAILD